MNTETRLDRVVFSTGGFLTVLGAIVITGWFTQNLTFLKILPSFEAMRFNTALGFSLAGVGLIASAFKRAHILKACGAIIGLIGALTIIEYAFGVDVGIDQLFVKDTVSVTYPGRLALPTAIGFTFIGASFLLLGTPRWTRKHHIFLGVPGSIIISLGVVGLIGFLSGHTAVGTWGDFISMAVHTAVGFLVLGAGFVASTWRHCAVEEKFLLQWLPLIIGVGVLSSTILLWRFSAVLERANIEKMLQLKTDMLRANISSQLESRVQALIRMANRWEVQGKPERRQWEADAELYIRHFDVYRSIMWVDPELRARWVAPANGDEAGMMHLVTGLGPKALEAARQRREAWISQAVPEKGGEVFAAYMPIYVPVFNDRFDGFIVGVFDVRQLFDRILDNEDINGFSVSISNNGRVIHGSGGNGAGSLEREAALSQHGLDLVVKVRPKKEYLSGMGSLLPGVILVSGILVSALLALVGYFAEKAQRRARTAEDANASLGLEIAERRRVEEELQENYEVMERNARELKRSNSELEQFASVASHDLQEPLRVISGYLQLLSRRYAGKLDASADEFIRFSVEGAARMQSIISDLLAFSRVGSGEKSFAPVDCAEVMAQTRRHLSKAIEESGAVITHGPLPTVTADASQLGQLFMNLVGNSIKYRADRAPSIHVATKESDGEWLFLLTDNGIGFDMRHSEKVFEMFKRLHGREKYSGTGIGLAICKKVVENHNGRIWVESRPGAGSTFFFTIPKQ